MYHHTLYHILPSISKETSFPPFPDNHPRLTWAKWQYCCLPRQIRTLRIGRGADNVSKCDTNWRHPLLLKNREYIEKEPLGYREKGRMGTHLTGLRFNDLCCCHKFKRTILKLSHDISRPTDWLWYFYGGGDHFHFVGIQ